MAARTKENSFQLDENQQDRNLAQSYTAINIASVNVYEFVDHSYNGNGGYRDGNYLIPFSRESDYAGRRKLAFYKNYVKPIVRAMVEPVFVQSAVRTVTDDSGNSLENLFTSFIDNCDSAGTHIQDFTHSALSICRRHGVVFIVMDNYADQPDNLKTAMDQGIHPYVYLKKAQEVDSYECDRFGNIEWIVFIDSYIKRGDKTIVQYRKWTRTDSSLMEKKDNAWTVISSYTHNLGVVPVIVGYSDIQENNGNVLVDPPVYEIARINFGIFNMCSEVRDQERAQAFSILYAQGLPANAMEIGPKNCIMIPLGATIAPGYASPDFSIVTGLVENQDKLKNDMFTIAEQLGVIAVMNSESGIAKNYDFFAHESTLKRTSYIATDLESKMAKLFMRYTNDSFVYTVIYKMDFSPMGLDREIDRISKVLGTKDINKVFASKIQEKLAKLVLVDEDVDVVNEVIDAIKTSLKDSAIKPIVTSEENITDMEVEDASEIMPA